MNWIGKEVSVVGLGRSNLALIRYLTQKGASITARDQKSASALGHVHAELDALGVDFRLGPDYLHQLHTADAVFLTPGMRKDLPQIVEARRRGVLITSEINLFFEECRAPIVGITGSNGKTTTTSLVALLLEAAGHRVYVGGNIGTPLIERVDEISEGSIVVLELSSFQLELLHTSPRVAVVTNVSPNHLDVHKTMAAYVDAKQHIFRYQSSDDVLVLNADDPTTKGFARQATGRVVWFSRTREVANGAFLYDGRITIAKESRFGRSLADVCAVNEIPLLGAHNVENVLAACAVGAVLGATTGSLRDVVTSFTGVAHRLELVREVGGIAYYNDSIATSPSRAIAGLKAFDRPVHLIAGGYDKGLPFDEFAQVVQERCRSLLLIGETADKIARAVQESSSRGGKSPVIIHCRSLEEAVRRGSRRAAPGDVVLLSPACASYDMFPNFEVRGERFRKAVHQVTEQEVPHVWVHENEH